MRRVEAEADAGADSARSGRGAYVCRCAECLRKARRAKRIERSLEVEIPDEVYDTLEKELAENE